MNDFTQRKNRRSQVQQRDDPPARKRRLELGQRNAPRAIRAGLLIAEAKKEQPPAGLESVRSDARRGRNGSGARVRYVTVVTAPVAGGVLPLVDGQDDCHPSLHVSSPDVM